MPPEPGASLPSFLQSVEPESSRIAATSTAWLTDRRTLFRIQQITIQFSVMKQKTRVALFAFALSGFSASLMSSYAHYQLVRNPDRSGSFSHPLGCETLYQSRFGVFHGLPVALGGTIWFALVVLLTLAAQDEKPGSAKSGAVSYLFLTSIAAFSVVLFLSYVSMFILGVVCIPCAVASFAVLGVFLISGASTSMPLSELPRQAVRDMRTLATKPFALGVAIAFLTATAAAMTFFSAVTVDSTAVMAALQAHEPTEFDLWFESQVRTPIDLPADGAQVLVVMFNDYQSPVAAETYRTLAPVLVRYQATQPNQVKLILKDYPLDPECNPSVTATVHDAACESAVAVRLAQRQQRGSAMQEWLYSHGPTLTPAAVRQAAKEIGGVADFESEYSRALTLIQGDVDLGRRAGVRGTPTFFINGVRIEGGLDPQVLDQAIAHELRVRAVNR
jgi:protein-disulfide isomerase/uncharacterized membrane protein